ncbi:hypothetical protein [Alsobacter sp. SYSU BS001988]|jgi:hypothetical protein
MPSDDSPDQGLAAAPRGYPALDEDRMAALAGRLEQIVELLHEGALTELQRQDMRLSLKAQIASSEALHRVRLQNSEEPAFMFHAVQG